MPSSATNSESGVPIQQRLFSLGVNFTRRKIGSVPASYQGRNIISSETRQVASSDQTPINRISPIVKKVVTEAAPPLVLAGSLIALQTFGKRVITPTATKALTRLLGQASRVAKAPPAIQTTAPAVEATVREIVTTAITARAGGMLRNLAVRYVNFFSRFGRIERTAASLTTVFTTTTSVVAGATLTQISDKDKLKRTKLIQMTKQKSDEVLAKNEEIKTQLVDRKSKVETELEAYTQKLDKLLNKFKTSSDTTISYAESLIERAKGNLEKIEGAVKELKVSNPQDTVAIKAAEQKIEQLKTMIGSKETEIADHREKLYHIQAKIEILSEAVRDNAQEALEKIEGEIRQATGVLQKPDIPLMTDDESSKKEFGTNVATFATGFLLSAIFQKFNLAKQLIGAFKGLPQNFTEKLIVSTVALSVQEKIKFHHDENISEMTAKEEINNILHEMGIDPSKHIDLGEHEEKLNQNIMNVFAGFTASLITATINNEALEKMLEAFITSSIQTSSTDLVHQHGSIEDAEKIIQEGFKPLENELNELLSLVEVFGEEELSQMENFTQKVDSKQQAALEGLEKVKKEAAEINQLSEKALSEADGREASPQDGGLGVADYLFRGFFWLANLPSPSKGF